MNVDISVFTSLQFILRHKEPAIQTLVEFVEDQATLSCYQCGVRVCVLLISDKSDRLTFDINFVHQVNKVFLVIAIVLIRFSHLRVKIFKNLLHDIVHFRYGDFLKPLPSKVLATRPTLCTITA